MKAIVRTKYGSPDILQLREVQKPTPKANEVLVKVHAASVNASDYEFLTGRPLYIRIWGLFTPKFQILGSDIAGTVEAVGTNITRFQPRDAVFGDIFDHWGGFAEYVCAPENAVTLKPAGMTFAEASAVPQAALVAMQGIHDKGQVKPGQKVLINGAGGGSGSFAVQIAKLYGAEVTGVDSTGKLDMMRSIGADHVIDYTREDFTGNGKQYDLILDLTASHPITAYKRALSPNGKYLMVGGTIPHMFRAATLGPLISMTGTRKMGILGVKQNKGLQHMAELMESGRITPVIDKSFTLSEVPEALRYVGEGHAKGKVVITVLEEIP